MTPLEKYATKKELAARLFDSTTASLVRGKLMQSGRKRLSKFHRGSWKGPMIKGEKGWKEQRRLAYSQITSDTPPHTVKQIKRARHALREAPGGGSSWRPNPTMESPA